MDTDVGMPLSRSSVPWWGDYLSTGDFELVTSEGHHLGKQPLSQQGQWVPSWPLSGSSSPQQSSLTELAVCLVCLLPTCSTLLL